MKVPILTTTTKQVRDHGPVGNRECWRIVNPLGMADVGFQPVVQHHRLTGRGFNCYCLRRLALDPQSQGINICNKSGRATWFIGQRCCRRPATARCGAGTFPGAPGELPGRRPDQALRERPVGLVRSLLQIGQTLGPGDVDVEVLDVDVDVVRRRGWRLRSPDCPG